MTEKALSSLACAKATPASESALTPQPDFAESLGHFRLKNVPRFSSLINSPKRCRRWSLSTLFAVQLGQLKL